jgi:hypothetical protein
MSDGVTVEFSFYFNLACYRSAGAFYVKTE